MAKKIKLSSKFKTVLKKAGIKMVKKTKNRKGSEKIEIRKLGSASSGDHTPINCDI